MASETQIQQQVAGLKMMGGAWKACSDEQLTGHVLAWFAAYEATGIVLTLRSTIGMTAEDMMAKAQAEKVEQDAIKAARNKRRAGVKALQAKYGHEAASDIVFKHSGRRIHR